jgi:DNA polymerase III sliding clamp (beta) subunit (PCNA family)
MGVEIPRAAFKSAVERLTSISESSKVGLEAFNNLRIEGFGHQLKIGSFNKILAAEVILGDIPPHEPFGFGASFAALKDLAAALPDAPVHLHLGESSCTISAGVSRFKLRIVTQDAFPPRQLVQGKPFDFADLPYYDTDLGELFLAIGKVVYCTDLTSERNYAKGVIVTPDFFYASDGLRLSRFPNRLMRVEKPIALPVEGLTRLHKFFKGYRQGGISGGVSDITLATQGMFATMRLFNWEIPRFQAAVPEGPADVFTAPREATIAALQRTLIVANQKSPQTDLHFDGRSLAFRTDEEGDVAEDSVPCMGVAPRSVRINPRYLLEAISRLDGDEVCFHLRGQSAVTLTDKVGEHINVIMPYRTN